ncbi:uncharacterized protein [Equus przewalskii]|uniref:Uncharacterized protein n=1 Tax=Equus przewalskii TaxID=9798 RepID=A0ABM2FN57_EQUPR
MLPSSPWETGVVFYPPSTFSPLAIEQPTMERLGPFRNYQGWLSLKAPSSGSGHTRDKTQMRGPLSREINGLGEDHKVSPPRSWKLVIAVQNKEFHQCPSRKRGIYRQVSRPGVDRPLGGADMAKATGKSQASSTVTEQPSPKNKERKMRKGSCQPRSGGSVKAAKKTTWAKRPLRRRSTKKASRKRPTSSVKSKEVRGTTLFGHYHRLNEQLNQDKPEEDTESMEKPSTSCAYLHHQQLQSEARDLTEESSEKSLTSDP